MVCAVICEYNPFHNGHKYLINQAKKDGDVLIAVMSGSFTQRGDIAVADKFSRAEVAVKNGADLVIELPTVLACAPAETFARGGVQLINSLDIVDRLCFGAEDADVGLLKLAGEAFDNDEFKIELNRLMKDGDYYPKAVHKAMSKTFSPAMAEVVKKPNNILAVEYIKALSGTDIEPAAIKRVGAEHDSAESQNGIASASYIRELIKRSEEYSEFVPDYKIENPADIDKLEQAIMYKLRTMSAEDFAALPDVSEGLENRLYDAVRASTSIDELLGNIKTKRYTMARIRRLCIYALLNITADMPKKSPPYARVLAFNSKGAELLKDIKKACPLPLITNVADGYKTLDNNAKRIFDVDLLATDIFNMATQKNSACGADFTRGVIKI